MLPLHHSALFSLERCGVSTKDIISQRRGLVNPFFDKRTAFLEISSVARQPYHAPPRAPVCAAQPDIPPARRPSRPNCPMEPCRHSRSGLTARHGTKPKAARLKPDGSARVHPYLAAIHAPFLPSSSVRLGSDNTKAPKHLLRSFSTSMGIRTPVFAVRGRRLRPLDYGGKWLPN